MVPKRNHGYVTIFVAVVLVCLLKILFWNPPLPILTNQRSMKVVVTVFYEALCPDSKYFLTKQLLPTFKVAEEFMEVQLAPYGKARKKELNGKITFDCQHGPTECQANIYHACATKIIEDPLLRLNVVTCMIGDNRVPQDAMHKCAKEHNIDYTLIQKCSDSKQGLDLLKLNAEATHALRPPVTFIPTITIDGSQGRQASILKDLFSEVIECKDAVTYLRESYKYHRRQVSFRLSKREADDGDALKYEDKVQWEFLLQKNNKDDESINYLNYEQI
ncbi:gamma-interferon-inducible lysosomal thiol reductase isoform X5 [Drosophila suzukii]|uniref:Gamma-interferon-inducible lysosomal thiol reductase isoform X5 n=1 Tax=Drosophila suzukii TaxID=28584 RepID=A0ABM4TZ27_DROSZ|nr:gamma-interferon-inducible lysosomal thiol reductase isoform X2 [Drosophila suzukii]